MNIVELLNLPKEWVRLENQPGEPAENLSFGLQTQNAMGALFVEEIPGEYAMPFGDNQAVIDGFHSDEAPDQALMEVDSGDTQSGCRFMYCLTKNLVQSEEVGAYVQYYALMHLQVGARQTGPAEVEFPKTFCIQIHMDEMGSLGRRDAAVYELMKRTGEVGTESDPYANWYYDPYDPESKKDFLMNRSEAREFDKLFPEHPLSLIRKVIQGIVEK